MRWSKLRGIVFFLALIAIWEIASRSELLNPLVMPAPARILGVFSDLVASGQIPWQILVSMRRAAAGYLLAAAVFIPLGIVMGLSQRIYCLFDVAVEMLRPVPPPVVIPVAQKKTLSDVMISSRSYHFVVSIPASLTAFASVCSCGSSRARNSPPIALMAHADITPSGVPPVPINASMPEPGMAAISAPATSPAG